MEIDFSIEKLKTEAKHKMDGAISVCKNSLSGLRAGRASPAFLAPIKVDAYGDMLPIERVANITAPEPRMLLVQVWDKTVLKSVEKAIANAGLGITPAIDGQSIRLIFPPQSEERRKELCNKAAEYSEQFKVSIRNIRRDSISAIKKAEKDKLISEDDMSVYTTNIQEITDDYVSRIDKLLKQKIEDIMTV
ncbi:Ribosome-recycling factor [Candidatus Cyrtobacter comes]|uniref:Ribosome-recycling factor n=1 Tax=Candidatus Cyrtobacter comes TaxID=675776 RepID=A0ABU5L8I3_9RICK|nr:ribosome recycling factor [Candidatus Cyrtobacter comes]MDZ5762431.1 Ribosome-recycling factor [Candidatus Cyrtobacter comes]